MGEIESSLFSLSLVIKGGIKSGREKNTVAAKLINY